MGRGGAIFHVDEFSASVSWLKVIVSNREGQLGSTIGLSYALRVRDLLHGFVYLTDLELEVIKHPLFQRLRNIKQNDVASSVYPSLNTSRFEHSLGCVHVAGKMARNLIRSPKWDKYKSRVDLEPHDFEQVCRLYALLHDVGHLPLSHLFEIAFEDYAYSQKRELASLCQEWFGCSGFEKLHEACGCAVATTLLEEIEPPPSINFGQIKKAVIHLMSTKILERGDLLWPVKLLIDSEIDADRIDSTARDGLLGGGEYGTHDIERLCSAVFLKETQFGWVLAFSEKALGSMEALLLDRYRTHTWIHYHHQVVALKVAVAELIRRLLESAPAAAEREAKGITKDSFPARESRVLSLRDDIWLWSLIRKSEPDSSDLIGQRIRDFVLYRDKSTVAISWKSRTRYNFWRETLLATAGVRDIPHLDRSYEEYASAKLGMKVFVFEPMFRPLGRPVVPLTSEDGESDLGDLLKASTLLQSLEAICAAEPEYYVIFFDTAPIKSEDEDLLNAWVKVTAQWIAEAPQ
jgi:HD superfamily phosphohydrolase